jgi:nuclear pore complex protein Nup98-Nup96
LLYRHASLTPQQYAHLVEKLCIPAEWIHQANAARMAAAGNAYAEYHELAAAKMYDAAHMILVKKLAPEAILRGDLQLVERLCGVVGSRARDWEYGGQVRRCPSILVLSLTKKALCRLRRPRPAPRRNRTILRPLATRHV